MKVSVLSLCRCKLLLISCYVQLVIALKVWRERDREGETLIQTTTDSYSCHHFTQTKAPTWSVLPKMLHPPGLFQQPSQLLGFSVAASRISYNTKWTNKGLHRQKSTSFSQRPAVGLLTGSRRWICCWFSSTRAAASAAVKAVMSRKDRHNRTSSTPFSMADELEGLTHTGLNILSASQPQKRKQQHNNSLHHQRDVRGTFSEPHL